MSRTESTNLILSTPRTITPDAIEARILPLKIDTPVAWVSFALSNLPNLLNDHMHLERKAAANVLSLVYRWPEQIRGEYEKIAQWVNLLTEIARDEVAHLDMIGQVLFERGEPLQKHHTSSYANDLRKLSAKGNDPQDLVDRLLVSSLIEARSCERFFLLAKYASDEKLAKIYHGLWSSEHGHYQVFLELAYFVLDKETIDQRFDYFLTEEAKLVQQQGKESLLHSWI